MKHHREFQYIYNKGRNAHSGSVVLFYFASEETRKVGFTATKKIGNAVARNRAKRRLRALFSEFAPSLTKGTYIFVAKAAINETTYLSLKKDFKKVLSKIGTITNA